MNARWLRLAVITLGILGLSLAASAQDASQTTRSARLSYLQGKVQVLNADNTALGEAQVNLPLLEGQRVVAGDDGQAEIEFEDGSVVRITPNSAVSLTRLNSDEGRFLTQIALDSGMAYFELRIAGQNGYFVTAGGQGITPVENATFRVSAEPQQQPEIAVMQGSLHVERDGGFSTNVKTGEQMKADLEDGSRYYLSKDVRKDSWDDWNDDRDKAAAEEAAQRTNARDDYAQDSGYGWSDLDANGNWYDLPGYGRVWQPPVAVDAAWDPYGYGSWVWYPGTGYVWVSGYNWGWAPYRCGNWSYWNGFGWGWMPGAGCNRWGWGYGSGWRVNVINPPPVWRPIGRPVPGPPGPGGVRPIIPVRRGPIPVRPAGGRPQPVIFNGQQIQPLRPVGGGPIMVGRGANVGSALRRDFQMKDRQPVMGDNRPRPERNPSGNSGQNDNLRPQPIQRPSPTAGQPNPGQGGWRQVNPGQRPANPQPQPGNTTTAPGREQPRPQPAPRPDPPRMQPPPSSQPRPVDQPRPTQQPRPAEQPRPTGPPPGRFEGPRPSAPPPSRPAPAPPK